MEELLRVKNLRKIYLLDNSESREIHPKSEIKHPKLRYMHMDGNLGYGKAHNIALRESAYHQTELHLVMNSDIRVKAEDIDAMHDWMIAHAEVKRRRNCFLLACRAESRLSSFRRKSCCKNCGYLSKEF